MGLEPNHRRVGSPIVTSACWGRDSCPCQEAGRRLVPSGLVSLGLGGALLLGCLVVGRRLVPSGLVSLGLGGALLPCFFSPFGCRLCCDLAAEGVASALFSRLSGLRLSASAATLLTSGFCLSVRVCSGVAALFWRFCCCCVFCFRGVFVHLWRGVFFVHSGGGIYALHKWLRCHMAEGLPPPSMECNGMESMDRWNAMQWSAMEWSRWNAMQWNGMEWMHFEHFGSFCALLVIFWTNKRHFKMSYLRAGFVGSFFGQKNAISKCRTFGPDLLGHFLDKKTPFQNVVPSGRICWVAPPD